MMIEGSKQNYANNSDICSYIDNSNIVEKLVIEDIVYGRGYPLLTEERGVGASREYLDSVKEVVDYAAWFIGKRKSIKGLKTVIQIPDYLCQLFTIFSNLRITVEVYDDGKDSREHTGAGASNNSSTQNIINNVGDAFATIPQGSLRNPVEIHIYGYSEGNILIRHTVATPLIHELNHQIETYRRLSHGEKAKDKSSVYSQTLAYNTLFRQLRNNKPLAEFIYYLFSNTEINALISGVYGEMSNISTSREDFREDIKNLSAYKKYKELKDMLEMMKSESYPDDLFANLLVIFKNNPEIFSSILPVPLNTHCSVKRFRKAFLEKAENALDAIIKGIGRVASYWFDIYENGYHEFPEFLSSLLC